MLPSLEGLDQHNGAIFEIVHHLSNLPQLLVDTCQQPFGLLDQLAHAVVTRWTGTFDDIDHFHREFVIRIFGLQFVNELRQSFFKLEWIFGLFK